MSPSNVWHKALLNTLNKINGAVASSQRHASKKDECQAEDDHQPEDDRQPEDAVIIQEQLREFGSEQAIKKTLKNS